jgi:hypothetical protein
MTSHCELLIVSQYRNTVMSKVKLMVRGRTNLSDAEVNELKCPVKCKLVKHRIEGLTDFLNVAASVISDDARYWFRGHRDAEWRLTPSALRFDSTAKIDAALGLMRDFRRIAEMKLERPPGPNENLKWLQLAQHYGIPTRLLDWTESAVFALYFAVVMPPRGVPEVNGIVFVVNPSHLSKLSGKGSETSLDAHLKEDLISGYFRLGAEPKKNGKPTIAINPVWNSERLVMQRGAFTLHGSRHFDLDMDQAPSLIGIPILAEAKLQIRSELDKIGIDEMTLFPELEHVCSNLKRRAGLS